MLKLGLNVCLLVSDVFLNCKWARATLYILNYTLKELAIGSQINYIKLVKVKCTDLPHRALITHTLIIIKRKNSNSHTTL